jgi:methylenetetrahydrofolate dehydrogenase (NADP+) / methenyltetrahydrofolate cyclohydrolase
MTARILDGKLIASNIKDIVKNKINERIKNNQQVPGLDVILIGDNPSSEIYVQHKQKACAAVGIHSNCHHLPKDTSKQALIDLIHKLNNAPETHGILLQLPLPNHLNADDFLEKISADKDVDGFHPYNFGRLALRQPRLRPCTPYGVMTMLKHTKIKLAGLNAVIVGSSNIVGRPMTLELLLAKCTVTTCHRFTENLQSHIEQADILISATGKPGIIDSAWIKPGAIVIDVGFSRLSNGKISGDIDFSTAKERASWITPVPGGVGPMTVATLLQNTLLATELAENEDENTSGQT